jgi:hypothetical protein
MGDVPVARPRFSTHYPAVPMVRASFYALALHGN